MHIPDGYLSPQTCVVGYAIAIPFWSLASRRVKDKVKSRSVPTLAVLAAVCFLVMMFNVPIPDGTTAHAVGGALTAILLGPWAAVIAVSVALLFQALLFGDGGVLAYGTNVFNMAIVLPFVASFVYRRIAGRVELTSARRVAAGAIAGYVGINCAALVAGIELGLQPTLFHNAAGAPLYSPYHLSQSVPAMLFAHLTIAGLAEAILTAGVIAYLQRANLPLLQLNHRGIPVDADAAALAEGRARRLTPIRVALLGVGLMIVVSPVGLLAPGGAFGEDSPTNLNLAKYHLSAVPSGLQHYNSFWNHAIFSGYDFGSDKHPAVGYVASAVVGIAVIGLAIFVICYAARWLSRRREDGAPKTRSGTPVTSS
jgi:cobalt/nickel transport system permease protein